MEHNLYIVSWNVTRKCNLRCQHCYLPAQKSEKNLRTNTSQELSTEEALQVIDQIALVNPEVLLILSGGEPILRKDIFELADYASGKGMMVVLGSNGLLINDKVAIRLRQCGVSGVSISLDSTDPRIHDGIRSKNGVWEAAIKAVHICRNNGLAVQINTTVTQKNYAEISGLIEYSQALGVKVFSPFFLICTGRGEELTDMSSEQYEKILSRIVEWQGRYDGVMIRTRCAPTFRRVLYQISPDSPLLKMDTGRCLAGLHYCRITPEGDVTACPYMPLPVGNVRKESFENIWAESEEFILLRNPSLKGKCRLCEFRLICGGCRARAFAFYKDYMEDDPWCAYTPQKEDVIRPDSFKSNLIAKSKPAWTEEAEESLKRVPFFVRPMVRGVVERYAMENNCKEITLRVMKEAKQKMCQGGVVGH